jgi:hypothetical protein
VHNDLDPVACRVDGNCAEDREEMWIKVCDGRTFVIEDRHAVGDDAVSLAERTTVGCGDRRDGDEQAGNKDPGHASIQAGVVLSARM